MIYNSPSIYKLGGGGGGGYNDGGQLVDGDLIKIENNTISSYDNVSRDPVKFYLDLKDGEIANAVVELTTAVNATINVYVLKNGFYYLMGNIGGNTVTAGDDYKVNITGDSYSLELINPGGGSIPSFIEIDGNLYTIVKINDYLWTKENIKGDFGLDIVGVPVNGTNVFVESNFYNIAKCGTDFYYRLVSQTINKINQKFYPFKCPTQQDIDDSGIQNFICSELTEGESNSTGFSALKKSWIVQSLITPGNRVLYRDNSQLNSKWAICYSGQQSLIYTNSSSTPEQWGSGDWLTSLRLCCKISDL